MVAVATCDVFSSRIDVVKPRVFTSPRIPSSYLKSEVLSPEEQYVMDRQQAEKSICVMLLRPRHDLIVLGGFFLPSSIISFWACPLATCVVCCSLLSHKRITRETTFGDASEWKASNSSGMEAQRALVLVVDTPPVNDNPKNAVLFFCWLFDFSKMCNVSSDPSKAEDNFEPGDHCRLEIGTGCLRRLPPVATLSFSVCPRHVC